MVLYKAMGHRHGTAESLAVLGKVLAVEGNYATARRHYEESLVTPWLLGESMPNALQ